MKLTLVQTGVFARKWKSAGLRDVDLRALERQVMENPAAGPLMKETGGLRKLRFARPGGGKSGGFRVCYVHVQRFATVYFVLLFAKNEQPNLTAAEKAACRTLIKEIEQSLTQGTRHA